MEIAAAAILFVIGVRAMLRPTRVEGSLTGGERLLVAIHDAARAAFWFSLSGLFVGFALAEVPRAFRGFVVVPIVLAGVRLLTAARLSRS